MKWLLKALMDPSRLSFVCSRDDAPDPKMSFSAVQASYKRKASMHSIAEVDSLSGSIGSSLLECFSFRV